MAPTKLFFINVFDCVSKNGFFFLFSGGGGARTYFLSKKTARKILFFPKKPKSTLFLAGLGRPGGRQEHTPPLRTPRKKSRCLKKAVMFFKSVQKQTNLPGLGVGYSLID
jgi:hypothetical protein